MTHPNTGLHGTGQCPYCDSLLNTIPANRCCPHCGAQLGADSITLSPPPVTARFCPGCGTKASTNYCPTCGRNMQNGNIAQPSYPQARSQQLQPGINCCPHCMSTGIVAKKRGFSWGIGFLGFLIVPFFGALLGFIGSEQLKYSCHNCRHTWKRR